MSRVVLENVSKGFQVSKAQVVEAVKGVSFTVEDRELLVLVGPSGSGKSTVLRLIAGLEEISSGTISIDSVVVNKVAPKDRDVAMVFQNFALYPHMTVYENLAFPLKLRKIARAQIDRLVRPAAEMLGLVPYLDRLPQTLSGGERQRVALGRAIVRRPKVFLFDEPLSNLDARMRVQMRMEITTLHQQLGATMIYVTHDQIEAMTLGDRVAVLWNGHIQQIDEPLELYNEPANLLVAGFIGSPPMNLLRGRLELKAGHWQFLTKDSEPRGLEMPLPDQIGDRVKESSTGEIILGLRPEHICLAQPSASGASCQARVVINARIELVERLGAETFLHASLGEHRLIVRMAAATRLAVGQRVALELDVRKAHLFDPATQKHL